LAEDLSVDLHLPDFFVFPGVSQPQHRRLGVASIDRKSPDQNSGTQTRARHQVEDFHPGAHPEVAVGVVGLDVGDDDDDDNVDKLTMTF